MHKKLNVLEENIGRREAGKEAWKNEIEKREESVEHKEAVVREGIREGKEIKKILEPKEREENRSNIIIKGLQTEGGR